MKHFCIYIIKPKSCVRSVAQSCSVLCNPIDCSVLAWRIPGMGEPGGLPSMGSHRVGPNWSDLAEAAAADCRPPGSFVYGIFQAKILEWVAISCSRGSSQPRDLSHISCIFCIGRWILYHCAIWKGKYRSWYVINDENYENFLLLFLCDLKFCMFCCCILKLML